MKSRQIAPPLPAPKGRRALALDIRLRSSISDVPVRIDVARAVYSGRDRGGT